MNAAGRIFLRPAAYFLGIISMIHTGFVKLGSKDSS